VDDVCECVLSTSVRAGPRSQQTPLSLAVIDVLNRHLEDSPLRSVHGLAKAVPTVSRSQLYLLLRGQAVIDVAELFAICEALGVTPLQVIAEAEATVGPALGVAAYDEPHAIEDEQGNSEEP
jgi:transcriptional regulator with XRE-family HTH domain